jgi:glycosyltransferase involved in cell wall biosynthesis
VSAELSRPVPVTFVSSHAWRGGAEHYLELLLDGLGRDWISGVVCLAAGPLADVLRRSGYPTAVIPTSARAPGILASAWRLRRLLARTKPAVVHANGVKAALVAVLATTATPVPVVWVKHDFSWDGARARRLARRCARVVGVSEAVMQTFDGDARVEGDVVHNGLPPIEVDRGEGRRLLEEALGPDAVTAVVLLVGRFDPQKGHGEVLAIAPELVRQEPGLRFALVGEEVPHHHEYARSLRQEVERLELEQNVRFLGHRDDALSLIAGSDLVLIPTRPDPAGVGREGFSYVALEALTAGTPVVAYADGGLPEVVGDCGLLVDPGDRAALAAAVRSLLEDSGLRERLGRCGRERVRERFSLASTVESMKATYLEVASGR